MRTLLAVPILLLALQATAWAADIEFLPDLDLNDPRALQEAIRLLDEEVKLAARPQTYVVIDLVTKFVFIKGRGIELHRFPIAQWSAVHLDEIMPSYRLKERPPVSRRKIDPSSKDDQSPISLEDMPTEFTLQFSPPLEITIGPSSPRSVWGWLTIRARDSWKWIKHMSMVLSTGDAPAPTAEIYLMVPTEHAQSLAWTATDGMPFLIRRTPIPAP